ncbi:hypothetical protein MPTK1_5g16200 [Marchantia polymorpha subsp. ruderalis]|uniref:Uncharacterized protein n=2 Tax=Marchantia polymorpha TaxID=3197 RepID=A0AAF6BIW7_MARPO|nr:hypothetical protein MARPO_0185s0007 [Marchantia polymorpha]BBN11951.1 hypothetical protein Mp_5g16200 [Marchantia polymorpha subsp. ruderalis]|eukprot:PTQ27731.1 hypothetical protein MARPO_0185s0007 [Marchantia polymorpha]
MDISRNRPSRAQAQRRACTEKFDPRLPSSVKSCAGLESNRTPDPGQAFRSREGLVRPIPESRVPTRPQRNGCPVYGSTTRASSSDIRLRSKSSSIPRPPQPNGTAPATTVAGGLTEFDRSPTRTRPAPLRHGRSSSGTEREPRISSSSNVSGRRMAAARKKSSPRDGNMPSSRIRSSRLPQ